SCAASSSLPKCICEMDAHVSPVQTVWVTSSDCCGSATLLVITSSVNGPLNESTIADCVSPRCSTSWAMTTANGASTRADAIAGTVATRAISSPASDTSTARLTAGIISQL